MTVDDVLKELQVFYGKGGTPYALNALQATVYTDALRAYDLAAVLGVARSWMKTGEWFPKLAELVSLLEPETIDPKTQALLAWSSVEQAIRRAGIYRGAIFEHGPTGEAFRQTFGSFPQACQFDTDSPGWFTRRQTFLAIYPTCQRYHEPVTMRGLGGNDRPLAIAAPQGVSTRPALTDRPEDRPIGRAEAVRLLAGLIERR